MDCLNTLIGLSQTTCDCWDTPPVGYNTSDSGKFVDEAKGFNMDFIDTANDCKEGGLWGVLERSRSQAIEQIQLDLNLCLRSDRSDKYQTCKGLFTSTKQQGSSLGTDFIAIRIESEQIESTCIAIKSIGLMANTSGTINWSVVSSVDITDVLFSGSFAVTPGGLNNQSVDINLPLFLDDCVELTYWLIYETNGVTTKSNKIWCKPCSGGKDPCYRPFFCQNGVGGSDVADIETWTSSGNLANGMIYSGEITCQVDICDYLITEKNILYQWIASALQWKSAECAYLNVLGSSNFSQYTTLDADCIREWIVNYDTWYKEGMEYICQEIGKQGHPCLVCTSAPQKFQISKSFGKRNVRNSNRGRRY